MAEYISRAPTLVSAPLFVAAMLYLSAVVGRRILLALSARSEASSTERFVIAVAIGLGVVQFLPFALGALGILGRAPVRTVLAVIFLVSLVDARVMAAACGRAWGRRRPVQTWEWIWGTLLAAPLLFTFFVSLAPSFDPDGVAYHLAAPKRWLSLGTLEYLPSLGLVTNGPMGTEMLFVSALAVVGDAGAKLLHFASALVAAGGVFTLGSRVGRRASVPVLGHVACIVFLYSPVGVYSVMGASYAEGTASLALVASALCWMMWFDSAERGWLAAASLVSGFAVSFKLTSVLFPIALAVLTALVIRLRGRRATGMDGETGRFTVRLAALCAAPMVPWMVRSWIVSGNPFFPVFARWIPSKNFPADVSAEFESYQRYMLWGANLGDSFDLAARRAIVVGVVAVVALLGGLVFLRQRDPLHRRITVVVVATTIVQVFAAGLYFRYWTPMVAVLQIPILAFALSGLGKLDRRVGPALVLVLAFGAAAREVPRSLRDDPGSLVLASVDADRRADFERDHVTLGPLYTRANESVAPGEAVLMGFHCAGFYIDGPSVCTETLDTAVRLSDWADFNEDLESLAIAYVIAPTAVAKGEPVPKPGPGTPNHLIREDQYRMLNRLLEERGELLATASDQSLYRLSPPTPDGDE